MSSNGFEDYYELLQISPGAEPETIQRVFRMLAQRYHPDNKVTGNEERFRAIHSAYRILSDPVTRAQYDLDYNAQRALRWKFFDQNLGVDSVEVEKHVRGGILTLLYRKRRAEASSPGMPMFDIESLIGRPREHLEFSLWFLREKKLVQRTDDNFFTITATGVEYVEEHFLESQTQKLLEAPRPRETSGS